MKKQDLLDLFFTFRLIGMIFSIPIKFQNISEIMLTLQNDTDCTDFSEYVNKNLMNKVVLIIYPHYVFATIHT